MKIHQLLEASTSVYLKKGGDIASSMMKGYAGNPPTFFILAADGQPIATSTNILFFKVNTAKFKELNYGFRSFGRTSEQQLEIGNNIVNHLNHPLDFTKPDVLSTFLTNLEKHKAWLETYGAFKVLNFNNASALSKMIILKYNMHPSTIEKMTGIHLDTAVEATHRVGNSELIFPDNIRKAKIDEITQLVTTVNSIVDNAGVGIITKCRLFVAPIPGNTIGLYYPGTGQMKIDPGARYSKNAVHTMLHEYGHKFFFEQMSNETRQAVRAKFSVLFRDRTHRIVSPEKAQQLAQGLNNVKAATSKLAVGDTLEYVGRKPTLKKGSPYTITELSPTMMRIASAERGMGKFSGVPSLFVNAGFVHNGVAIETPKTPDGEATPLDIDLGWFPTQYSKTNYEEWWAELFAFTLEGRIKDPEVIDYIKSLLR